MTKGILTGFFCFSLFLLHIFVFHIFNIKRRFFAMVKGFSAGVIVYCILYALISEAQAETAVSFFVRISVFAFLSGAALHFMFCYLYLYFVQIIDRTPTTRIMIEIEESAQKRLTLEQLKQLYSIDKKIYDELQDMVALGRLNREGPFYSITTKGRMHMSIFRFARGYLKLRRS